MLTTISSASVQYSPFSSAGAFQKRYHDDFGNSFSEAPRSATPSVPSPKSLEFRFKMGRLRGGPSRTGAKGAYLDRYVTDEQRSSRPIFNATLRAAASWLFFRVACSTRMTQIWALCSRLEKQPTDLRQNTSRFGDRTE